GLARRRRARRVLHTHLPGLGPAGPPRGWPARSGARVRGPGPAQPDLVPTPGRPPAESGGRRLTLARSRPRPRRRHLQGCPGGAGWDTPVPPGRARGRTARPGADLRPPRVRAPDRPARGAQRALGPAGVGRSIGGLRAAPHVAVPARRRCRARVGARLPDRRRARSTRGPADGVAPGLARRGRAGPDRGVSRDVADVRGDGAPSRRLPRRPAVLRARVAARSPDRTLADRPLSAVRPTEDTMERAGDEQDRGAWSSRDAVEGWPRSSAARHATLAAATERRLDLAALRPGVRVLDLGTSTPTRRSPP